MLSIIPSLFEHLERQPRRSPWFAGQTKATVLQSLSASPKYVADEHDLQTSLARRHRQPTQAVTEMILGEMSDHTVVTRPPLEPMLVIDYLCDTTDEASSLWGADLASFRYVAVVSWHPGRRGGQDLSVLAYGSLPRPDQAPEFIMPLWLGLNTRGVRTLNTSELPSKIAPLLRDLIPVFCYGVTLSLHVLANPGCSITPATGEPIRIGHHVLKPETIFRVQVTGT